LTRPNIPSNLCKSYLSQYVRLKLDIAGDSNQVHSRRTPISTRGRRGKGGRTIDPPHAHLRYYVSDANFKTRPTTSTTISFLKTSDRPYTNRQGDETPLRNNFEYCNNVIRPVLNPYDSCNSLSRVAT
jgi:hypothetical protein